MAAMVDEDYDDSEDAKEQDIESFKAERAAKDKARADGRRRWSAAASRDRGHRHHAGVRLCHRGCVLSR
jgi:hypothetical protein